jgi:hypothetical protein
VPVPKGRNGGITGAFTGALAGEQVQLQPLAEDRLLVYYRRTCIREIDLQKRQSFPAYYARQERAFEDD